MSFDPIEEDEDVLHHEIFSDWRYLECKIWTGVSFRSISICEACYSSLFALKSTRAY